jgi:type IV pilus assembly protein PilA
VRGHRGFTLIELMIVVAIIGLLASIALPAYQTYTVRSKLSEVILAASACRATVSEVYLSGGTGPGINGWGCEFNTSKYVQGVTTDVNGVVTVVAQNISPDVNGKALSLFPYIAGSPADASTMMGQSVNEWRCAPAVVNGIALKYLPGGCRQN